QTSEIHEKLWFSGRLEDEKKVHTQHLPHSEDATEEGDATGDASVCADATSVYRGAHGDRDTRGIGFAKFHNYCNYFCFCSCCDCRYFYLGVNLLLKLLDNIFCKGSVDTTIIGVDTMAQNKGRNVKKSSTSVDTRPGQVDTSNRSTPDAIRSTLDGSPRGPVLQSGTAGRHWNISGRH
ncbi:hypothetical protein Taro_027992, partial [Colocasia esculenta]|nr:hypothetical protein [Colocasia esculenta]